MHKNLLCFIRFYKYPDQMLGNTIIDYLEKDIGWRAETDFKTGIKSIYDALRRRKI